MPPEPALTFASLLVRETYGNSVRCGIRSPTYRAFMSSDLATCQYDASPSEALAAVRTHQGPLLVDVDETLYLRNSTQDFIDCAWPGLLTLLLLRVLDVLKPCRLTGGIPTRDTWRASVLYILFSRT